MNLKQKISKKMLALGSLLLPLTVNASPFNPESVEANARFLEEHPAVAKLVNGDRSQNTLPLLTLGIPTMTESPLTHPFRAAALASMEANMISSDAWTGRYTGYGLYSFHPSSPMSFANLYKGDAEDMVGNGGSIRLGNRYYLLHWEMGFGQIVTHYYIYDTETWQKVRDVESNNHNPVATDLAYDRENGVVYGAFFRDDLSGWELGTVSYNDNYPVKTPIGPVDLMVVALGVNKVGEIYGICEDGVLYRFDKQTAEATRIGDTGVKVASNTGIKQMTGEFDQHRDVFYWAANDVYGNWTLYTVDVATAAVTKVSDITDRSQLLNMQVLAPEADDKAPNALLDFDVTFEGPSTTGIVTFTVPTDTYDGTPMDEDLWYMIYSNGNYVDYGDVTPGESVTYDITLSPGERNIDVYLENDSGESPHSSKRVWVGYDVPLVTDVEYTADNHNSTVRWTTSTESAHGGYMEGTWYKVVRMPGGVTVADNLTEKTCTDVIPEGSPLAQYYYIVTPCNQNVTGEGVASNTNLVGEPMTVPYEQNFNSYADFINMEVIDANKDGYTWAFNSDRATMRKSYDLATPCDDWILTPPIQLEAGKSYKMEFQVRTTADYENVEACYGTGADLSTYTTIVPGFTPQFMTTEVKDGVMTSAVDQAVRFGVHRVSSGIIGTLNLYYIHITEEGGAEAPGVATDVTVTVADLGALSATVAFKTPVLNKDEEELNEITHTDIYVDGTLAKTIETPLTGTQYSAEVPVTDNGFHSFTLVCRNSAGEGTQISTQTYVGVDTPARIEPRLIDAGDELIVEWNPCTTGKNGAYVDPSKIRYNIYQTDGYQLYPLVTDLNDTSYDIPFNTSEGVQGGIQLIVSALNEVGEGAYCRTNILIVGEPYSLPYEDHFDKTSPYAYDAEFTSFYNFAEGPSSDGDSKSIVWMAGFDAGGGDTKTISTLKIAMDKDINPMLSFDYLSGGGEIEVYAMTRSGQEILLATCNEEPAEGWGRCSVDLSGYCEEPYMRFKLVLRAGDPRGTMAIDNLRVQDVVGHNLALKSSVSATRVSRGQSFDIFATVTNLGTETSGKYQVNFMVNGELFNSQKGNSVEFTKSADFHAAYNVPISAPESLNVKVEIEYEADQRPADNTVDFTVTVAETKVSAPEALDGVSTDGGVTLTWKAPTTFYCENRTEDFEDYDAWTISNFGDWKAVDVDKAPVIGFDEADYHNEGAPQAFTIFNPLSLGMPDSNQVNPHSGCQYLACFAADVNVTEHNDDWFISPLLSGDAQEIVFFAKMMRPDFGNEKLQVLSTSGSREIEDFQLLEEYELDNYLTWRECKVALPEDTQYFAIRVITRDGFICIIDDITFTAGSCHDITGWRVYCDDSLLAETTEPTYFHAVAANEVHKYNVTALYATGEESDYSAPFHTGDTGIFAPESADRTYDVYSVDGRVMLLKGSALPELQPGIYVINGKKVLIGK